MSARAPKSGAPRAAPAALRGLDTATRTPAAEAEAERAADRIADAALAGAAAPWRCSCGGGCPRCRLPPLTAAPAGLDHVEGAGQPLAPALRRDLEPRFGADFGAVRVHTDARAAAQAEAAGALAYSVGRDLIFAAGRYAPLGAAGRRLLAHELAHVVQQQAQPGAAPALRFKKKPDAPPRKFYQDVIDEIATQEADQARQRAEKQYEFMVHKAMNYHALKALLPLAEAVDAGRVADIPPLVAAFVAADHGPPFRALSSTLLVELASRLFTLGLEGEANKLWVNFSEGEKGWDWIRRDVGLNQRNIDLLAAISDRLADAIDLSAPDKARATLAPFVRVVDGLRIQLLDIDPFELTINASRGFRPAPIPAQERQAGLLKVLARVVATVSQALQTLLDGAATQLAAGDATGAQVLVVVRDLAEALRNAVDAPGADNRTIGHHKLTIATAAFTRGAGRIDDAFGAKRSVAVGTYSEKQKTAPDLQASVASIFATRRDQALTMATIYGAGSALRADRPAEQARTAEAARNAKTLATLRAAGGQLRLDNDDDWRAFMRQKFADLTLAKMSRGAALSAVIALLFDYLQAFTVHARFTNLYDQADFKDAYFNRPFPRALSGQLVHDCGVYAMRVAYILSMLREDIGLRVRYLQMPAHVGLVIEGEGLPTYFVHNNHFSEMSPDEIATLKAGWKKISGPLQPTDDDQFIAEVAAQHFIAGQLDTPFRFKEASRAGSTDAAATKRALWADYQQIAARDVFGKAARDPKSPGFEFHTRYLASTERLREWHNASVVPFWNGTAVQSWVQFEAALRGAGRPARSEPTGAELWPLLDAHRAQLEQGAAGVEGALEGVHVAQRATGEALRADPKLVESDTGITASPRIKVTPKWQGDLEAYQVRLGKATVDAALAPTRRFAVEALVKALDPPFVPVRDKGLVLLE